MDTLEQLAVPLLEWFRDNARPLPWRDDPTPYHVWLSEIMLQQTRVAAVLGYYRRFLEEAPDIAALAALPEDRLLKLWQGLGYYNRARNLQRAARVIVEELGGVFPDTYEALLRLPGVGEYTAGAVASIAFGEAVPAVDGNVLRVIARTADIREDISDAKVRRTFRALLEEAMPREEPGKFNQALMELGATVCAPNGAPDCGRCPLSGLCEANRLGIQTELPLKSKKAPRRVEEMTVYLLRRGDAVALRRRGEAGLLAGLWEFPHVPGALGEAAAGDALASWGLTALDWEKKISAKHVFTHVEWHMTGYLLTVRGECPGFTWADREALETLAVPSAFARYLEEARRALDREEND